MNEVNIFFQSMEKIIEEHPDVFMKIEKKRSDGNWRIQVFGRDMGIVGDSELLFAEAITRDEAFTVALMKIDNLKTQIKRLKESRR